MSSELNCRNCGASLVPGARFCRQCGHPSANFDPGSVIEEKTRILETPERRVGAEPAYVPPVAGPIGAANTGYVPSRATETQGLSKKGGKLKWFIVGGLCVIVITMIAVLAAAALLLRHRPAVRTPTDPRPRAGAVEVPQPPVPPPPPAIAEGEAVDAGALSEYVYPGAKVNMRVNKDDGSGVLNMNTTDPPDKVKDWYKSKFNTKTSMDFPKGMAILEGDSIKAVITPAEDGTNILLTMGES
jgi:zinc-ribbon domain